MGVRVEHGDCMEVIPRLVAEGVLVDAIVCDPPYGLEFMGKEWDGADGFRRSLNAADAGRDNVFGRTSQTSPEYRPGWQNGGGFTKPGIGERETAWPSFSAISPFGAANPTCGTCGGRARGKKKCSCAEPAWKAIGKRRNPENEGQPDDVTSTGARGHLHIYQEWNEAWAREALAILKPGGYLLAFGGTRTEHRLACAIEDAGFVIEDKFLWVHGQGFPKGKHLLKPACEIVTIAYRPGGARVRQIDECRLEAGSRPWCEARRNERSDEDRVAYGKGLAGSRAIENTENGRWPTNFSHDGSDEVLAGFPDSAGQQGDVRGTEPSALTDAVYSERKRVSFNKRSGEASAERRYIEEGGTDFAALPGERRSDAGSAARFFYSSKADRHDRWGSKHPTVKPVDLIKHLVALHCPPGGLFLDCFAGSGTAGVAALATGRNAILIERDDTYIKDIRERMAHYEGGGRHSLASKGRNARERPGTLI